MERSLHPRGMDTDALRDAPYSGHDRAHLTHLTTIVGHVHLLRSWAMRTQCLNAADREVVLQHVSAIERAGLALQQKHQSPTPPTSET